MFAARGDTLLVEGNMNIMRPHFTKTHLHRSKVVFVSTTSSVDELLTSPRLEIEEESWHESVARPSLHGELTNWVDGGWSQVPGRN